MKNTLKDSYQDHNGQWWYLQPTGIRQRAKTKVCLTCKEEYLTYPSTSTSNYCSIECYRKKCKTCNKEFNPKTIRQIYCSKECKQKTAICKECNKTFIVSKGSNGLFCSPQCYYDFICPVGSTKQDKSGYMIVKVPAGTIGTKVGGKCRRNWMLQHRYVMQQILGRTLGKYESVHHINGKRNDNRPENLELWKRSQPAGIRSSDYHCAGCRCHEH